MEVGFNDKSSGVSDSRKAQLLAEYFGYAVSFEGLGV